jgi:Rps23 Pro-64 3,4-dihydroxylase Tpa1-like proline 4-hydroxylase
MEYNIIEGKFPILTVNNFLSENNLLSIEEEIRESINKFSIEKDEHRKLNRIQLDDVWENDRDSSNILSIISNDLFSKNMLKIYNSINDSSFRLIEISNKHETQITIYNDKNEYSWHNDKVKGRIINWVLFIDLGMDFTGGENQISYDEINVNSLTKIENVKPHIITKPKGNMLLLMPSWVSHRVSPVKSSNNDITKGRITINGHIGFKV